MSCPRLRVGSGAANDSSQRVDMQSCLSPATAVAVVTCFGCKWVARELLQMQQLVLKSAWGGRQEGTLRLGCAPAPLSGQEGHFRSTGHPNSTNPGFGGTGGSYSTWALPGS